MHAITITNRKRSKHQSIHRLERNTIDRINTIDYNDYDDYDNPLTTDRGDREREEEVLMTITQNYTLS